MLAFCDTSKPLPRQIMMDNVHGLEVCNIHSTELCGVLDTTLASYSKDRRFACRDGGRISLPVLVVFLSFFSHSLGQHI
jgi:hypothetical protein